MKPAQHTLVRNQAIEDDALIYLSAAQAAGWRTRLSIYNAREREWRSQRHRVVKLRQWITKHVDPAHAYSIRGLEGVHEALAMLRKLFPPTMVEDKAIDDCRAILDAAGQEPDVNAWFRQWVLAFDKARRLNLAPAESRLDAAEFLRAVKCYDTNWASIRLFNQHDSSLEKGQAKTVFELTRELHIWLEFGRPNLVTRRAQDKKPGHQCPCSADTVPHEPEKCWYVQAVVNSGIARRGLKKARLARTREALEEPQWAYLVSLVKEDGAA